MDDNFVVLSQGDSICGRIENLGKVVVWAEECINKTKFSKASDMDNSI
jgi:hypothetical protein